MIGNKNKIIFNCILTFSILALASAYFIQHILGHQPCNLCLIERIPYFASTILFSLIFILNKHIRLILFIITLFFIFGSIVSFYHVGIEQGLFSESFVCNLVNGTENFNKEGLLKEMKVISISCKDVTFSIFGLSLATINTIISLFISVIMIKILIKNENN